MMTLRILIPAILISFSAAAQNLVINPGAEDNPRGTGWTIISAGPTACGVAPSNTYLNWTMIPDGSGNYPAAHGGTRTFYSGCSATAPAGTRKIRIRLQTMVGVTPDINAYFDDISLTTANTLPLTLISFKGQTGTGYNLLDWSTAEEINTDYFSVERSIVAGEWNEIARIDAAGNSNTTLHYNFRDHSPQVDFNCYRLKMVDIDGSYTLSHVIKLSSIHDGQPVVNIFPNPNAGLLMVRLSFARQFELKILSNTGQLMRQQQLGAKDNHSIDIRSLSPGLYILQLTDQAENRRNFSLLRQ